VPFCEKSTLSVIESPNAFPPTEIYQNVDSLNALVPEDCLQDELYNFVEQSIASFSGGFQNFTSLEPQLFDHFALSQPFLLPTQDFSNQVQGFGHPFDVRIVDYYPQGDLNGLVGQSFGTPNNGNQGLITSFEAGTINNQSPDQLSNITRQNCTRSSNSAKVVEGSSAKTRYLCSWIGCGRSFSRAADRDRHLRTNHGNARRYHCSEPNCNKGAGFFSGYSRVDKLQEHMRVKHAGVAFRGTM
jgi:hypothetical protein